MRFNVYLKDQQHKKKFFFLRKAKYVLRNKMC